MKNNGNPNAMFVALFVFASMLLLLYAYPERPLVPALQSNWLYPHLLGVITYSAILFSLVTAIYGSVRGDKATPAIAIVFQQVAAASFLLILVTGIFWARYAWGSAWHWDPKETWSLIFVIVQIGAMLFAISHKEDINSMLAMASIQIFFMFLLMAVNTTLSGAHGYGGFEFAGSALREIVLNLNLRGFWSKNSWIPLLVTLEIIGIIPAYLAYKRGCNFLYWLIYGGILFPVAIVHVFFLREDSVAIDTRSSVSGMKKCPHCAEMIRGEAKVCRYCSRPVDG